ncbi:hypothetical protein [Caldibacillus debilis]
MGYLTPVQYEQMYGNAA